MERLPEDSFTWSRWRAFNLFQELGIICRYDHIVNASQALQRYAIGFHEGERLRCRPKVGAVAVMFLKDNVFSWCHLTAREFKEIFNV